MSSPDPRLARLIAETRYPGLHLLILFGSRARGDAGEQADWDLGYLGDESFEPDVLLSDLAGVLRADRIDLVDLARAGGQLRYRAARDGRLLFEARRGEFAGFWMEAVTFWCDVVPVLRSAYAGVLERLSR